MPRKVNKKRTRKTFFGSKGTHIKAKRPASRRKKGK